MSTPSSENQGYNARQIPPRQSRVENDDAKTPPTQNNEEKETAATNETVDNATPNARFKALVSRNQTESPNPPDAALRNVSPANPADSSLPASAPAPNRQSDAPISAAAPFVVSGLRVPSASSTPSRSSANVPPKPKLTVKLHLDAPQISIEKISKFCTETLPAQRLNYPKIKEPYYFRLDLGALFRQTVDEKSLFRFSYVEIDPQFEERYGLRCALDADALVVAGTPKETFDGYVALELEFQCRQANQYHLAPYAPPAGVTLVPPSKSPPQRMTFFEPRSGRAAQAICMPFIIHADPWDLWRNLPTPKDAPYQTPNAATYASPLPRADKLVLAASQRGRSHEHDGKFRDDSFAVKLNAFDGWSFFAVGDGAGSAQFSRMGSKIACETVVELLAKLFELNASKLTRAIRQFQVEAAQTPERAILDGNDANEVVGKLFIAALRSTWYAIDAEVASRNQKFAASGKSTQIRDYHTTLLCCALKKFETGWTILSYWVGDGGFVLYRPNGEDRALALGSPDGGEFVGLTRFFTMTEEMGDRPILNRVRVAFVSDFDALALATDGVSDPYFETENDLAAFRPWQKFWQARQEDEIFHGVFDADLAPNERAERLTQGLRFKVKGHHDDRTILLVLNPDSFATPPTETHVSAVAPPQIQLDASDASNSPEGER